MLFNVIVPETSLTFKTLMDLLNSSSKEGPGSGSWVQNLNPVNFLVNLLLSLSINLNFGFTGISQSHREVELLLQNIVYSSNNEINYWLRSVPNTSRLFEFRIIFTKEGFIKMNNRVVLFCGLTEVFEDGSNISRPKHISKRINNPVDSFIKIIPGKIGRASCRERV